MPQTGQWLWTKAPGRPLSGTRCMKTSTSHAPPQRDVPDRSGGGTASDYTSQCLGLTPVRGGWGGGPGAWRSSPGMKIRSLWPIASPPSCKAWIYKRGGDSLQVDYAVRPRYGAHGVLCCEGFFSNIFHWGEALVRKLSKAGEEPPRYGLEASREIEQWVNKVHRFVMFDSKHTEPLKPRDRVKPRGEMTQEVVDSPARLPIRL